VHVERIGGTKWDKREVSNKSIQPLLIAPSRINDHSNANIINVAKGAFCA
jgi:hypothetical protein